MLTSSSLSTGTEFSDTLLDVDKCLSVQADECSGDDKATCIRKSGQCMTVEAQPITESGQCLEKEYVGCMPRREVEIPISRICWMLRIASD